jgi:hypothetical protein
MKGALLLLLAVAVAAAAGSGGVDADASSQRASALATSDLAGIPAPDRALTLASERWQRLARRPVASLRGLGSAHPGAKSIRVSTTRAALTGRAGRQRFPYPRRTVIVKTATSGGAVTLVAIMRKVAAGRAASSWRYVEYTRSGASDTFSRVAVAQSLCVGCHVSATDTQKSDYVFSRLSPPGPGGSR